jgi:hypothetical protein
MFEEKRFLEMVGPSDIDSSRPDKRSLGENNRDPVNDHVRLFHRLIDNAVSYGKKM